MPALIQAKEYPLEKVFCDDYVFQIPNYQRPYSWETEHAAALLNDLLEATGQAKGPLTLNPYFLGSVVLIKGDGAESEILDGQQRLTTLTILLSILRESLNGQFAEDMNTFIFEKGNALKKTSNRYRLSLRAHSGDDVFLREYIQEPKGVEKLNVNTKVSSVSQKNIQNNALYYQGEIKQLSDIQRQNLATFIINNCFLVIVSTPDFDSAYRIFSILNDRGLDLTHSDIIKSEVIGKITSTKQDEYTKKWDDVENNLGRDYFNDLFSHIRMIYRKEKLRENILTEIRKHIKPSKNPINFIDSILIPYANAMDDIMSSGFESAFLAEEINKYFGYLRLIDNSDWLPAAILYLANNRPNPKELLKFFKELERLSMGLMILRMNVNERITRYGSVIQAIQDKQNLYINDSPLQLKINEKKEILEILDGDIYESTRIRLPILIRLDAELSAGGAKYDYKVLSIEHVLPQNPAKGSKWLDWYPDIEARKKTVHRIGNLVLLSRRKNSQAQNFEFDRKKSEYFQRKGVSPFALTTQVLNEKTWEPDVFEKRQASLLEEFKKLWRL